MTPEIDPPPPLDAAEWEKAAGEFLRGSLDRIRSASEKWTGSVAGLLGLFGTVAVVAGPSEINKISGTVSQTVIVVIIVVSGLAAGVAMWTGALAAQGTPRRLSPWGGEQYRAYVNQEAKLARKYLLASRAAGMAAACLVFIAGVIGLIAAIDDSPQESGAQLLVVTRDGRLICGKSIASQGSVTVDGQRIDSAIAVTPVTSC